jgi:flagellar protein FliS
MTQQATRAYRDNEGLADPLELVRMTYRGVLEAVGRGRQHLRAGEIAARSRELTRAGELIGELVVAVDLERGGELGERLLQLYEYMQHRLQQANSEQADAPLVEVERLLATLAEAWEGCRPETSFAESCGAGVRTDVSTRFGPAAAEENEAAREGRSYSLSGGVMA